MRVLIDTNFLMIPFKNRVDIFAEFERVLEGKVLFIVLSSSLQELRNIKGKDRLSARAMLDFIANQSEKFEIIKVQGKTDDLIIKFAEKEAKVEETYFATMDKELRDKLRKMGARLIILRGRSHLDRF